MKLKGILTDFLVREWLLTISGAGFIFTSFYTGKIPVYSINEFQVLFILFVLFVTINGLQHTGLISELARHLEKGRFIPLKLMVATFFLSMLITNDIALIVVVPLTLFLNVSRKDILVILEALAANAGSALTPFGNPQNLFIFWYYDLHPTNFILTIAPFSLIFLLLLIIASFFVKTENNVVISAEKEIINKKTYIYIILLIAVISAVLRFLPVSALLVVLAYVVLFDRRALRIDYALLLSFFFFFGLADNLKILIASEINHSGHIFLLSAIVSQFISNVPATLLFAKFTSNWQALLWGTNAGGFGSLFGSLANLIAYKIYVTNKDTDNTAAFTARFLIIGYGAFFIAIGLYFAFYNTPMVK